METSKDRILGCIVGGALGDALGVPYECQSAPVVIQTNQRWRISDDTLLTLATCEAIVESKGITPEAIARTFRSWYEAKRLRGMGASTVSALFDLSAGAHWATVGARGEMAAGNGAAMRAAPLAFVCNPDEKSDRTRIRDICRITHHNEEAYVGALAVVLAVKSVMTGVWKPGDSLVGHIAVQIPDSRTRDRLYELHHQKDDYTILEAATRYGNTGYVVDSVPLALFIAQRAGKHDLETLLRSAVEAGGDTDTIASMAGQVAGTYFGLSGIDSNVIDELEEQQDVLETAGSFARYVEAAG